MYWSASLTYFISPRSGPMRRMETLLDANRALSKDLGFTFLKQPHWRHAGQLLLKAADTGAADDIRAATNAVYSAIEREGWMSRSPALSS
jgi:hypothetical protein